MNIYVSDRSNDARDCVALIYRRTYVQTDVRKGAMSTCQVYAGVGDMGTEAKMIVQRSPFERCFARKRCYLVSLEGFLLFYLLERVITTPSTGGGLFA